MYLHRLAVIVLSLFTCMAVSAEEVVIDFQYQGTHSVDLSRMRAPIYIAEFTDGRGVDDSRLITDADLGDGATAYMAESALPALIQNAMLQGFQHGEAKLTDATDGMRLEGNLLSSDTQLVDRAGVPSIQITLRTSVQLINGSRTIWQTTLFGRGVVPVEEGLKAAVDAALDRSIRELVGDDYFLMEII